jgi:hypothetical protein
MWARAGVDRRDKFCHTPGFDPRTLKPVVSWYTNWAIQSLSNINTCLFVFQFGCVRGILKKKTIRFVTSFHPSVLNNSVPTGRILMKFVFKCFSKICQENASFINIWEEYRVIYVNHFLTVSRQAHTTQHKQRNTGQCFNKKKSHYT